MIPWAHAFLEDEEKAANVIFETVMINGGER